MTLAAPLVAWAALGKSLGAAFLVVLVVALCFGLVVRGSDRRHWGLVVVGTLGCAAAVAAGIIAMLHK
jgi:uncharacterized membrane protein HdeD (DUF308 family)